MADHVCRGVLKGAAAATAFAAVGSAAAQVRSDNAPKELDGKPMPEPPVERSAGPIRPGRGSLLQDKVAVVTGAARGMGRAIAVEMAANGADVVVVDIVGQVSPASNAIPAKPKELDETVRMIKQFGRRSEGIKAASATSSRAPGRRPDRTGLRQDRHRRRERRDTVLDASVGDAGFGLARRD
jgi:hypothetical protein